MTTSSYLVHVTGGADVANSVVCYGGIARALRDHCLLGPTGIPVAHEEFVTRQTFPGFVIQSNIDRYSHTSWRDYWEARRLFLRLYQGPSSAGEVSVHYYFVSSMDISEKEEARSE